MRAVQVVPNQAESSKVEKLQPLCVWLAEPMTGSCLHLGRAFYLAYWQVQGRQSSTGYTGFTRAETAAQLQTTVPRNPT